MMKRKTAIVIPAHKSALNEFEKLSLKSCNAMLPDYDKILVTFKELNVKAFTDNINVISAVYFDKSDFQSIDSYNALMKSEKFYEKFLDYDYILIYQTDCYLFNGDLAKWTDLNYSYIGAPWINKLWLKENYPFLFKLPFFRNSLSNVGNGGLSLRKVSDFHMLAKKYKFLFKFLKMQEDILWSNLGPRFSKHFKLPDIKTAAGFSFDEEPEACYKLNNNNLPFGCHGWHRYNKDFWEKIIK